MDSQVDKVEENEEHFSRLGDCQQCSKQTAKYTCPACSFKTCSATCVKTHKVAEGCSGVRDKTAYKQLSSFTELDLLSDYRLLEEVGRSVDICHRDVQKRSTRQDRELPIHLYRLRAAARKRGIQLHFMPPNFTRHKNNSTFLDWKTQQIEWRVEWRLPKHEQTLIEARFPEDTLLIEGLKKQVTASDSGSAMTSELDQMKYFLPAEHEHASSGRYFELNPALSLSENLKGKTIVEHPVIYVVPPDQASGYLKTNGKRTNPVDAAAEPRQKRAMSFYEVSEGEITSSDDEPGKANYFNLTG